MMDIMKALCRCWKPEWQGMVMGELSYHTGRGAPRGYTISYKEGRLVKVRASDPGSGERMEIILLSPRAGKSGVAESHGSGWRIFSADEVRRFSTDLGDHNAIHQTARPIVSGFQIAAALQKDFPLPAFTLRFHAPLYADEPVAVVRDEGELRGYAETLCFVRYKCASAQRGKGGARSAPKGVHGVKSRVFLLGGFRSYIGIRGEIFKTVRPEVLGGKVLAAVCDKFGAGEVPDLVICGNAVGPGGNIGRLTVLEAGLPGRVPAFTVDLQCASGLAAIDMAASKIAAGEMDFIIAGGTESASLAPRRIYQSYDPRVKSRNPEFTAAQFRPGEFGDDAMLLGAERAAKAAGITREEADAAALVSQQKALAAREAGFLTDVILPLFGSTKDEAIRPRMSEKLLKRAPRVTDVPGGILTAANTCTINDGAAFVALASEDFARRHGLVPKVEIAATKLLGGDPAVPPLMADKTVAALLAEKGLSYADISAFEYNEAFAVISADFNKKHPHEADRFNQWGGALAYGHPYGASGAEIMIHLVEILTHAGDGYGIAAIPAAGGVGEAVLVKAMSDE